MSRVRVGINLLYLKPGLVGGSETYVTSLLRAMREASDPDVELTLLANRRFEPAKRSYSV